MAAKNPFDMSELFKAFDPESLRKMFDPNEMVSQFKNLSGKNFDLEAIMKSNTQNLEALASANKSALEAYKDLLEKQRLIWDQMMTSASETASNLEVVGGTEAASKNSKLLSDAAKKAFELMQEMAQTTADANAKAFEAVMKKAEKAA
ncbi:MAG: phasin family protein [Paracoccaceae bacterium]|nr:phasin family protein [Paracoccaceae bacterium]